MSEAPAILIQDCSKTFGSLTAVDQLNLSVRRGEIFGLVGPDGAGKTTTLRMLCGLVAPSKGQIQVAGHNVSENLLAVKDRIGYMAQRFGMYVDLSVQENLHFYAELFGIAHSERDKLMGRLLRMTRMEPFRERQAGRLSGGMKQKLALMCSLLHRPEILILDEPTNGVDPVSRRDFWIILYQLVRDGLTVLMTTAYLDEAERCNRVGLMFQGSLIRCDSPNGLKAGLTEQCYEITAPNLRRLREVLKSAREVISVEPSGGRLHVFFAAGISVDQQVNQLTQQGLGPVQARPITPSLEDIFILEVQKASMVKTPV